MRKVILVGASFLACVCLVWAGGDPWKDKPYLQWDEKDVNQVLNNSPWAKVVRVEAPWRDSGQSGKGRGSNSVANSPRPSMRSAGGGGYGAGAGGGEEDAGEPSQGLEVPEAPYLVRWSSSRAVREAILRDSLIKGKIRPADAEKGMALPIDEYAVLVAGPDMTPFEKTDENGLKGQAYLMTKKTKQRIMSDKVELVRGEDGKSVTAVAFYFPKKAANGEDEIAPDEKGIEFLLSLGQLKLKVSFDPSKMSDQQGRDL